MNRCICHRVAPDYAADLSVPNLDRGRNAKEREIGFLIMYTTVYIGRPTKKYYYLKLIKISLFVKNI